jgi:hypothetical protein
MPVDTINSPLPPTPPAEPRTNTDPPGLTSDEASRRLQKDGLSLSILGCEFVAAALFGLILDGIKIPILSRFGIG